MFVDSPVEKQIPLTCTGRLIGGQTIAIGGAPVTEVFYRDVSLEDVIQGSERILTVKRAEPFKNIEKVPIHEDGQEYPPFTRIRYRFEVTGRLWEPDGESLVGKTVLLLPWTDGMDLCGHKRYYLEGVGESPIIDQYQTKANLEKDNELILFISIIENGEIYYRAYESIARKDCVLAAIANAGKQDKMWPVRMGKPTG